MLNRIKKLFTKDKGFTLVELLAVIVILGVILAIAVPMIGNVIGDSQEDAKQANIDLIENAARLADASGEFGTLNDDGTVTETDEMSVADLHGAGYLEDIPVIPGGSGENDVYSGTVTKQNGTFTYDGNGKPVGDKDE